VIRLRTWPAVPKPIRSAVRAIVKLLPEIVEVPHSLRVYLLPAEWWLDDDGNGVEGQFQEPASGGEPRILVAGLVWDKAEQCFLDDPTAVREVVQILLHEFAHYEQFKSGKKTVERGVAKRVKELMQALTERGLEV
jgi:hypothetical protein